MNILVTIPDGYVRNTFIPPEEVARINSMGNVVWNTTKSQWSSEELSERLKDVDVCICGWFTARLDENVLKNANRLKVVAYTAGSVAGIVSDTLFERGIKVLSGNTFFGQSVAEGVIAYTLCALRDLPYYNKSMKDGGWRTTEFFNQGLLDQTVGLVGFGMTTKFVINMLKPFNCKIKVFSNSMTDEACAEYGVQRASLEEIFSTCRIVSIHTAKRPDTYHMINKKLLQMLPDGALIVNTARGSIIDEEAMIEELETGRIKAALDVFEVEPLPVDSKLRSLSNVLLIPHMAGPTIDRRRYCTNGVLDDVERFYKGEPLKYEIDKAYAGFMTKER